MAIGLRAGAVFANIDGDVDIGFFVYMAEGNQWHRVLPQIIGIDHQGAGMKVMVAMSTGTGFSGEASEHLGHLVHQIGIAAEILPDTIQIAAQFIQRLLCPFIVAHTDGSTELAQIIKNFPGSLILVACAVGWGWVYRLGDLG